MLTRSGPELSTNWVNPCDGLDDTSLILDPSHEAVTTPPAADTVRVELPEGGFVVEVDGLSCSWSWLGGAPCAATCAVGAGGDGVAGGADRPAALVGARLAAGVVVTAGGAAGGAAGAAEITLLTASLLNAFAGAACRPVRRNSAATSAGLIAC
jgi:hypothetical protein